MEVGGGGQTKMEKWSHTLGQGSRGVMRAAGKYLYKLCNLYTNCTILAQYVQCLYISAMQSLYNFQKSTNTGGGFGNI